MADAGERLQGRLPARRVQGPGRRRIRAVALPSRDDGPMGTGSQRRELFLPVRGVRHPTPSPARCGAPRDPPEGAGDEEGEAPEGAGGAGRLSSQPRHVPGEAASDAQAPEEEGGEAWVASRWRT